MEILKFYSPTCQPCKVLANLLHAEKVETTDVNVFDDPSTAAEHGVFSVPTLIVKKDGEEVARHTGLLSSEDLWNLLASE
jgi:thioredoxin 1